jgi:hypothetical protein
MEKNNSKTNTVLLIVLVIFAFGIIWIQWNDRKAEKGKDTYLKNQIEVQNNTNEFDSKSEVNNGTLSLKEFEDKNLGFSFLYPSTYIVSAEELQGVGLNYYYQGMINSDKYNYSFTDFDHYQDNPMSYKYQTMQFPGAIGIYFWRSNGSGPYECYEDQDCTPYSDEFQFGIRFDLKKQDKYKTITFYGSKIFRDGKTSHTLADVINLPEYKDLFEITKTFKQL